MQPLTPAFQQVLVCSILDERMLEAVIGIRGHALNQQDISVRQPIERGLERRILNAGYPAKQRVRKTSSDHGADLRDLSGRAKSVEPCHQRLLQGRGYGLDSGMLAPLQQKSCHFLDE
jgi:hypothetical protein